MSAVASSSQHAGFDVEPDLHPLYPSPSNVHLLISPGSGLSATQKAALVSHSLTRTCLFADLGTLQYLLRDPEVHPYVDLNMVDEDGMTLISVTILGFGAECERDVEREECVRLLISEGADASIPDRGAAVPRPYFSRLL